MSSPASGVHRRGSCEEADSRPAPIPQTGSFLSGCGGGCTPSQKAFKPRQVFALSIWRKCTSPAASPLCSASQTLPDMPSQPFAATTCRPTQSFRPHKSHLRKETSPPAQLKLKGVALAAGELHLCVPTDTEQCRLGGSPCLELPGPQEELRQLAAGNAVAVGNIEVREHWQGGGLPEGPPPSRGCSASGLRLQQACSLRVCSLVHASRTGSSTCGQMRSFRCRGVLARRLFCSTSTKEGL